MAQKISSPAKPRRYSRSKTVIKVTQSQYRKNTPKYRRFASQGKTISVTDEGGKLLYMTQDGSGFSLAKKKRLQQQLDADLRAEGLESAVD